MPLSKKLLFLIRRKVSQCCDGGSSGDPWRLDRCWACVWRRCGFWPLED